ncbi:uncharacterized protein LOC121076670 [Cygnus olor]|uniref:uncharacterized protein LOC121076670 n=1 Tax=Cygnus olor TaxID=8869 RepID=UPI001ADEA3B6|nr:uncharacterized protein LOC121076670 [Cygnus olor]
MQGAERRVHSTVQSSQLHAGCGAQGAQQAAACRVQGTTGCWAQGAWHRCIRGAGHNGVQGAACVSAGGVHGEGCRVQGTWLCAGCRPTAGCRVQSRAVGQPRHGAVWYGTAPAACKVWCGHLRGQARPRLGAQPQTRGMEATSSAGAIPRHDAQRAGKVAARTQGAPREPLGALRARRSPGEVSPWALRSPASPAEEEQRPRQRTGLGLKTSDPSTRVGRTRGSVSGVSAGCILWKRPGGKGRQRASSRQRGAVLFWHGQEQQKPGEGTEVGPWGISLSRCPVGAWRGGHPQRLAWLSAHSRAGSGRPAVKGQAAK